MQKDNKKDILQNLLKKLLDKKISNLEKSTKEQMKALSTSKELTTKMSDILSDINKKKFSKREKDTLNKDRMIGTYHLKHEVPICIAYYTAYPNENNQISIFPDVYGYDRAMYKHLRIFL